MKNTKLWHLYSKLSKPDSQELHKSFHHPQVSVKPEALALLEALWNARFGKKPFIPVKEEVFFKVWPGKKYDDQNMRLLQSYLLKEIEQFLVQKTRLSSAEGKLTLAKIYDSLSLARYAKEYLVEAQEAHEKSTLRDQNSWRLKHEISHGQFRHDGLAPAEWEGLSDELDIHYFSKKLRLLCLMNYKDASFLQAFTPMLTWELLNFVKKENLLQHPAIGVYYSCFKMLRNNSETDYRDFSALVCKHNSSFEIHELRELYLMAIQFCEKKLAEKDFSFKKDNLGWMKRGLLEVDKYDMYINSPFSLRNIVTKSIKLKEHSFAEEILAAEEHLADTREQANCIRLLIALACYEKGDFQKAKENVEVLVFDQEENMLAHKAISGAIKVRLDEYSSAQNSLLQMRLILGHKKLESHIHEIATNWFKDLQHAIKQKKPTFELI